MTFSDGFDAGVAAGYARLVDSLSASQERVEETFTGEDGLQCCAACKRPVQVNVEFLGIRKTVNCACDCIKARIQAYEDVKQQEENERNRRSCFTETNMAEWTFAKDDRKNPHMSDVMHNYADKFSEFRSIGKGLLLFGDVGTGKTFYAACIANALLDKGYKVLMTNFITLAYQLEEKYGEKQKFMDSLNRYDLLILDDLGVERDSASGYMQEIVYNVIDSRQRAGLPYIITTNLTADQLKNPAEVRYKRIYDRILEKAVPIEIKGESRRRQALRDTHADMKAMLGL